MSQIYLSSFLFLFLQLFSIFLTIRWQNFDYEHLNFFLKISKHPTVRLFENDRYFIGSHISSILWINYLINEHILIILTSTSTSIIIWLIRLAGQIGWVVSIAPDVVKSTIQTSEAPLGMIETTKQIVASRGVRGLFAGVEVLTCVYVCMSACMYACMYISTYVSMCV